MGVSTPGSSLRSIAIPTSAEITLFDADFTFSKLVARVPWK